MSPVLVRLIREARRAWKASQGLCTLDDCQATAEHEALIGCAACGSAVWHLCCDHSAALEAIFAEGRQSPCAVTGGDLRLVALEDLRPH